MDGRHPHPRAGARCLAAPGRGEPSRAGLACEPRCLVDAGLAPLLGLSEDWQG